MSRRGGQSRGSIRGSGKQFNNDRYDQQQRRRSKSHESLSSGRKKGLTPPAFKPRPPPPLPDELAALTTFVKKSRFDGTKPGYFFSRGKMGVGYYIDRVQIGGMGKKGRARLAALIPSPKEAVAQIPAKGDLQKASSGGDNGKNYATPKVVNSVKKDENERKNAGVAPTKSTKVSPSSQPRETSSIPSGSNEVEPTEKTRRKPKGQVEETRGAGDSRESLDEVSFDSEGDEDGGDDSADSTNGGAAADRLDDLSSGKSEKYVDGEEIEEQEDDVDEDQEQAGSSSDERSNSSDSGDEEKRLQDTELTREKKQEFEDNEAMSSRGEGGDEEEEKKSFEALGVTAPLCEAAAQLGWSHATEIQRQSLPLAFEVRYHSFCTLACFDPP